MTQKLRQFTGRELIAILRRNGFEIDRLSGSHLIMIHPDGQTRHGPGPAGRTIGKGLLRSLMADARLTREDMEG